MIDKIIVGAFFFVGLGVTIAKYLEEMIEVGM